MRHEFACEIGSLCITDRREFWCFRGIHIYSPLHIGFRWVGRHMAETMIDVSHKSVGLPLERLIVKSGILAF